MTNTNNRASKAMSIVAVVALVFALNVSGAFSAFWRINPDWSMVSNPLDFLYGWGTDGVVTGYGYGYGYSSLSGYGEFVDGTTSSGGGSSSGGGGGGGWSSSGGGSTGGGLPQEPSTGGDSGSCTFPNLAVSFSDVSGNWAENYINNLAWKGIVNGASSTLMDPEGKFEPNRSTTRIEMLKIALRTFCYEYSDLSGTENFADVANGSWQARVVEKATSLGVIAQNTNFRPNDAVSRAEAIKMFMNVGSTRAAELTVDQAILSTSFTDVTVDWQAKYFEAAKSAGVINGQMVGDLLIVRPNDSITRSETSKVAVNSQALWNGWTQAAAQ